MAGHRDMGRRTFLKTGAAQIALGGYALSRTSRASAANQPDPYGGLKMGAQSYSFRNFSWEDAVARLKQLGLTRMEFYPGHVPETLTPDQRSAVLEKLRAAGVTFPCYGVVGFGADDAKNRRTFEFAKVMGIDTITADPARDSLNSLDALVAEFGIRIAIHNHGPGARYATVEDVLGAMTGHHELIGAAVDTGHFERANVNSLEAMKRFGKRIYSVHIKDVDAKGENALFGKGKVDLVGVIQLLREMKFDSLVAIEFEANPENPVPPMEECLKFVRKVIASS